MSDWKIIGKVNSVLPGETILVGSMIVGRVQEADICIPLGHMSRQHASLVVDGDTLKLKDLGSSNGTFVNGHKITEVELHPGDIISFDEEEFVVQGPVVTDEGGEDATFIRPAKNSTPDEIKPVSAEAEAAEAAKLAAEQAVAAAVAAQEAAEKAADQQASAEQASAEQAASGSSANGQTGCAGYTS